MDSKRKIVRTSITEDAGPYTSVIADFETENFNGELLDTSVSLCFQDFSISYKDREKFMKELAKVVKKYQI